MAAHDNLGAQFNPTYENKYGSAKVTPSGYVFNVAVRAEHRGEGHGTALMQEIASHADAIGKPLQVTAREALHPWYKRLGFEPSNEEAFGGPLLVRQPKRAS